MEQELRRKLPATLVMPKPAGTAVIRRATQRETLRELKRLQRRGYVHSASEIAQFSTRAGGGYGVKVYLTKPLPAPVPGWAKGTAIAGAVLIGTSVALTALVRSLSALIPAAAAIPWAAVLGGAVVFLIAAGLVKRAVGGDSITIVQQVTIKK